MGPTIYPEAGDAPGIDTLFHIVPYNDFVLFMWLFNFFWVDMVIAKKINHGGHGLRSSAEGRAQRVAVFSVPSVLSVVFPKPISEDNKKSPFHGLSRPSTYHRLL